MKELYSQLNRIRLFSNLDEKDFEEALEHLHSKVRHYRKGDILMISGAKIESIGIMLSGHIEISRVDFAGNRLIINQLEYPSMFGEALACADIDVSPVTLTALTQVKTLLIDFKRFVSRGACGFKYHDLLVRNMLGILAEKNLFLRQRLELLSKGTIRAKLCAYLFHAADASGQNTIEIPYNRLQLADYLGVNRSALSKELCKMRDEGLLEFRKNRFLLCDPGKVSALANQSIAHTKV